MTKKKILTIIGIIVVVASVGLNVYYFGWNKLVTNYRQQGFNVCVGKLVEAIQQTGQVKIGDDMILVPQAQLQSQQIQIEEPQIQIEEPKK